MRASGWGPRRENVKKRGKEKMDHIPLQFESSLHQKGRLEISGDTDHQRKKRTKKRGAEKKRALVVGLSPGGDRCSSHA